MSISSLESKQRQSNSEVAELQAKVGECERLLEDNRNQVCCSLCIVLFYITVNIKSVYIFSL